MKTRLRVHGRTRVGRIAPQHRAALLVLTLVFTSAIGCEAQRVERKSAATETGGDSKAHVSTDASHGSHGDQAITARQGAKSRGATTRVRLTQKGCIQVEPVWTQIRVGQSLTWHSDLELPVTIHVSPGAFEKTEYVVRAGASTSTGPARSPGSYSIWTSPAACQGVPRGVQGAGPGVTVEGAGKL